MCAVQKKPGGRAPGSRDGDSLCGYFSSATSALSFAVSREIPVNLDSLHNPLGCGLQCFLQSCNVFGSAQVADDHHAQHALAAHMRTADPVAAVAIELLDKRLMGSFCISFVYSAQAEVQDGQSLRRGEFKVSEFSNQAHISEASCIWRSIISSYAWRPCTRSVSQSLREFMRRDHCALTLKLSIMLGLCDVRHVGRSHGESSLQHGRMAGQDDSGGEGHGEPFVRVDRDGVGALNAAQQRAIFVTECGGCSVSAIDVQPESVTLGNRGQGVEIVDGSRTGGARGGNNAEGKKAAGVVGFNLQDEARGVEPEPVVDRNPAHRLASESEQPC